MIEWGRKGDIKMIPFADYIIGLAIAIVVCAVLGYVVYRLIQKQNAKLKEVLQSVPEEQKEELMNASFRNPTETVGMITEEPKVGAARTKLKVLVYNMYYPNQMKEFMIADVSISTKKYNEYQLKQNSSITISLNENGAKAVF